MSSYEKHKAFLINRYPIANKKPKAVNKIGLAAFKRGYISLSLMIIFSLPAYASDESLIEAVNKTIVCSNVKDSLERLVCFDNASKRLASIINPKSVSIKQHLPEVVAKVEEEPVYKAEVAAEPLDAPLAAVKPVSTAVANKKTVTNSAAVAPAPSQAQSSADEEKRVEAENLPTWASAPQYSEEERAQDSTGFVANIVRITKNGVGRHKFYTDDGAVWEQTQLVNVRPPNALPAVATFKRRLTGNPTIQFDVSSQSYRVRRIK